MMTEAERIASRKRTLYKYNRSEKRKAVNRRYRETHRKQCSLWTIKWMKENRERVNKNVRARYKTPEGKSIRQAISKRYAEKNRIKRLAKDTVHNAIRAGKLNKMPCAICGIRKTEGHHPDYKKPLKVVWLCKKHHTEVHSRRRKKAVIKRRNYEQTQFDILVSSTLHGHRRLCISQRSCFPGNARTTGSNAG